MCSKNMQLQNQLQDKTVLTSELYHTHKEEMLPILHNLFQKVQENKFTDQQASLDVKLLKNLAAKRTQHYIKINDKLGQRFISRMQAITIFKSQ